MKAAIALTIPHMLAELVRTERTQVLEADSVRDALDALCAAFPQLRVHLFDETGSLRSHVSCFLNDSSVTDLGRPVGRGDRIVILQAVSGG